METIPLERVDVLDILVFANVELYSVGCESNTNLV